MTAVRQILEKLGRDTLVRLIRELGLSTASTNEGRRDRLATFFGENAGALLTWLRRAELCEVVRHVWNDDGEADLPGVDRLNVDQLKAVAASVFVQGTLPPEYVRRPEPTDEEFFAAVGTEWSRPLSFRRLLPRLGLKVPQRLHASRFREAMERLTARGLELRLESERVLHTDDESPGLDAKVQLRRLPVKPHVTLVQGTALAPAAVPQPTLGDFDRAIARLELLTALPSAHRRFQSDWPRAFLDVARQGCSLTQQQERHLLLVAQARCFGHHDIEPVFQRLSTTLRQHDWAALLGDFERLNIDVPNVFELRDQLRARLDGATTAPRVPAVPTRAAAPHAVAARSERPVDANMRTDDILDDLFE